MGKPAARRGDMTAHGGVVVAGVSTVLIGGKPAARVGDMHVCPASTGDTPHVGGPVSFGSPTVLIAGSRAARVGDVLSCVGPPDAIAMGCPTVLIGDDGGGEAGTVGSSAGSSAASSAVASAQAAMTDNLETSTRIEHWVEYEFVDKAGNPVSGVPYAFTGPDGKESHSVLRLDGKIRRDRLPQGQCKVQLRCINNAKWSKSKANVSEKVKMSAEVEGYESGTSAMFEIYEHDLRGADIIVATVEANVQGTTVEGEWEYLFEEDRNESQTSLSAPQGYSAPEYYFEVLVGRCKARSDFLVYRDSIEIELQDEEGQPIADEEYVLYFSNGETRKGKLDSRGFKKEESVPPVTHSISFPKRDGVETADESTDSSD